MNDVLGFDRLWNKVDATGDCWLWTASQRMGYGSFRYDGKLRYAHRLVYELLIGDIPNGLTVEHHCRVRTCVNPAHLSLMTSGDNSRNSPATSQSVNLRKTHCVKGHPYSPDNTIRLGDASRRCKKCANEQWNRWYGRRNKNE